MKIDNYYFVDGMFHKEYTFHRIVDDYIIEYKLLIYSDGTSDYTVSLKIGDDIIKIKQQHPCTTNRTSHGITKLLKDCNTLIHDDDNMIVKLLERTRK